MLKRRLIPKLLICHDYNDNKVIVTTKRYKGRAVAGDPVSQARIYQHQVVDELLFLNIDDAEKFPVEEFAKLATSISEEIFMPVTFGGGIRSEKDVRLLLKSGADKISINSKAIAEPTFITELSDIYGAQCVVVSIDYKMNSQGRNQVYYNSGNEFTDMTPLEWAIEVEKRGAGEILLTSIDNDGSRNGIDIEILHRITETVSIPVIASGGCGLARHFVEAFKMGMCDAVSAGTYFAFKDENPIQCRSQIFNAGIPIRRLT